MKLKPPFFKWKIGLAFSNFSPETTENYDAWDTLLRVPSTGDWWVWLAVLS
jgi:hypothetical protein